MYGCGGWFNFGAFAFASEGGTIGVKYDVSVVLKKAGTNTVISNVKGNTHKMIWGFHDVDIADRFSGNGHNVDYYDSSTGSVHPWAEHVTLWNVDTNEDNLSNRFYGPIYTSKPSVLGKHETSNNSKTNTKEDVTVYHEHEDSSDNTHDNTTAFLVRINPAHFSFTWQGSGCATRFVAMSGTMYTGHSMVYKGGSVDDSKKIHNATVKVSANQQKVLFYHYIDRNDQGPATDYEDYYIEAGTGSGPSKGTAKSPKRYKSERSNNGTETTEIVYNKEGAKHGAVSGNPITVSLAPGEKKVLQQTLYYQLSNINTKMLDYVSVTCNKVSPAKEGTVCTELHRPRATFTGNVGGSVTSGGGNTTNAGTEITDNTGEYTIKFNASITRNTSTDTVKDEAGGTASTSWWIKQTDQGTDVSGSRKPASNTNTTKDLTNGQKDNVVKNSDNYTFSGRLRYGETREICAALRYNSIVGNTPTWATKCIKVWRKPKPCAIDASNEFGVKNGENLGRIGVSNKTLGKDASTPSSSSSFTDDKGYTVDASIWARPGDSIRFIHEGCAGGAYAVNNSSLDNSTYKSIYKSEGSLNYYDGTTLKSNNKSGYLFGEKIPTKISDSPLAYSNSRSWDSSRSTKGTFMSGEDNDSELSDYSPSITNNSTYSDNIYNDSTYECTHDGSSFEKNHYQVTGQGSDVAGCHASTKTATKNDVGHVITQSLSWNHLKITNGSANSTYENNKKFTAKAYAKVPYNYVIQSAVYAQGLEKNKVVYLGGNATFKVDLHVLPRQNDIFGTSNDTVSKYATITKPTTVRAEVYVKHVGGGETPIKSKNEYGIRFNKESKYGGTEENYASFKTHIDDSLVSVGDQVCVRAYVSPVDSHNDKDANTVKGAGANNAALNEEGSSSSSTEHNACYSVAKRPTISIEGSNAYAAGDEGFLTSRYSKTFGDTSYTFGSWSEYGVFGRVALDNGRGMASGATFGYVTGNNHVDVNASRANNNSSKVATNLEVPSSNGICALTTQTFTNSNCNSAGGSIGAKGINSSAAEHFRSYVRERYVAPSDARTSQSSAQYANSSFEWNSGNNPKNYGYVTIGGSPYANLRTYINHSADENGINRTYVKTNAYLGSAKDGGAHSFLTPHNLSFEESYVDPETGESYSGRNHTRVIQVTNENSNAVLVIDSDIKVGSAKKQADNSIATSENPALGSSGDISQVVIIADKILITSRVKQIDAIIIANEVNTCAYTSLNNLINDTKAVIGEHGSNSVTISSNTCNEQLHFRAPVFTNKLTLNRTFGAGRGESSVKRAEIFDLNPYTHLWIFNQMSRYSQAVTTYSRELPPRY